MDNIKIYMVFHQDWTYWRDGEDREIHYEVGKRYKSSDETGFELTVNLSDYFKIFAFDALYRVAEVRVIGKIIQDYGDMYTDEIEIIREVPKHEVFEMLNDGEFNTGVYNSGDYNTGWHNSGDENTGSYNSGDNNTGSYNSGDDNSGCFNEGVYNTGSTNSGNRNSGFCNSGNRNSGGHNSGNRNSGHYNSGDFNTGNGNIGSHNSGDWNSCDFSSGCFNTETPKIYLFNKPSPWTYKDWVQGEAYDLLFTLLNASVETREFKDMSDEEKSEHPSAKITREYLIYHDKSEYAQAWWERLSAKGKQTITSLPNFDKDIFKEITGIDVDK